LNYYYAAVEEHAHELAQLLLRLLRRRASAYVLGFHRGTLLLPQAIAGVLSVALVHHLVRRTFGPVAGLLSALVMAITRIAVTSRNNTMDMLLVAEERGLRTSEVPVGRSKDLDSRVDVASTAFENVKRVVETLVEVGEGDALSREAVASESTGAGLPSTVRAEGG
jgi:hypothetical protein